VPLSGPKADTGGDEAIYAVTRRPLPGSPFNVPIIVQPLEQYAVNDRVSHDQFGLGSVIGVEPDLAVLVDFGSVKARILAPYSKLTKL
jgi:hypothetical protein